MDYQFLCKGKNVINKEKLMGKMESIDLDTLSNTVFTRFNELNNPLVTIMTGANDSRSTEDYIQSLTENPEESKFKLIHVLATTIVMQHLLELTHLELPRNHKHPVVGFMVNIDQGDIIARIRTNGVHEVLFHLINTVTMTDLITSIADLPSYERSNEVTCRLTYLKLILELIIMNDHTLDSVKAYSETQHDWCLSSISKTMIKSHNHPKLYEQHITMALMSSLIYGCGKGDSTLFNIPESLPDDPSHGYIDVQSFLNSTASQSCFIQYNGGGYFGNRKMETVFSAQCNHSYKTSLRWMWSYEDVLKARKNGLQHPKVDSTFYRRSYCPAHDLRMPDVDLKSKCYSNDLPEDYRSKVTRELIVSLEKRTHFISRSISYDVLGEEMSNVLESVLGLDDVIKPKALYDVWMNESDKRSWIGYEMGYGVPYLFSEDSVFMRGRSGHHMRWKFSLAHKILEYVTTDVLDEERLTKYDSFDDATSRYFSFMKLYVIHKIFRFNEVVMRPGEDELMSPFERWVMDDVIRSSRAIRGDRLLCLDDESGWYEDFTGECMSICGDDGLAKTLYDRYSNGKDLDRNVVNPEHKKWSRFLCDRADEAVASNIVSLYERMTDGDLQDIERQFQRLDDVLVDSIIDYHLKYRMGEGRLPEEFLMESMRMGIVDRYENAGVE